MFAFPCEDMLPRQQKVFVLGYFFAHIDDTSRADQLACRNGIQCVIRVVLTGNPVNRGIKMCTSMFAEVNRIPVPCWAFDVIMRDGLHGKAGGWRELWRKVNDWR